MKIAFWIIVAAFIFMVVDFILTHRRVKILTEQTRELDARLNLASNRAGSEYERAERFKRKVIEQSRELDGLREALERATIHQPPPTPGE